MGSEVIEGEDKGEETSEKGEEGQPEKTEEEEEHGVVGRPSFKDIKAKYPNLFKDFPDLREMFFREQGYSELFPTVEDAKEAYENSENYGFLRELVEGGTPENTEEFLGAVKDIDKLQSFAYSFLPALQKVDQESYFKITLPIVDNVLKHAFLEGRKVGNKNLELAAQHLSQFIFGDASYASGGKSAEQPKARVSENDDGRKEFEKEKREFFNQRTQEFGADVISTCESQLRSHISSQLKNVESEFLRDSMVERVVNKINNAIESDRMFQSRLKSLSAQAVKAGLSRDHKERIVQFVISRARSLTPGIIQEVQRVAKVGRSPKVEEEGKVEVTKPGVVGGKRVPSAKEVDWNQTSDDEFLAGNVKLKGNK